MTTTWMLHLRNDDALRRQLYLGLATQKTWGVNLMWEYQAEVLRVVDGDTVDVRVDLGFKVHFNVRVRMYGMNAPESRTRNKEEKIRGLAAKERLEQLLEDKEVVIKSHGVGKFGRCLGTLYVNEKNINAQLISEGHATEYYGGRR